MHALTFPFSRRRMAILGIHSHRLRNIPLFLVYLATLMHCYSLTTRHAAAARARSSASLPRGTDPLPGVAEGPSLSQLESLPIPNTPSIRLIDAELAADSLGSILTDTWTWVVECAASGTFHGWSTRVFADMPAPIVKPFVTACSLGISLAGVHCIRTAAGVPVGYYVAPPELELESERGKRGQAWGTSGALFARHCRCLPQPNQ